MTALRLLVALGSGWLAGCTTLDVDVDLYDGPVPLAMSTVNREVAAAATLRAADDPDWATQFCTDSIATIGTAVAEARVGSVAFADQCPDGDAAQRQRCFEDAFEQEEVKGFMAECEPIIKAAGKMPGLLEGLQQAAKAAAADSSGFIAPTEAQAYREAANAFAAAHVQLQRAAEDYVSYMNRFLGSFSDDRIARAQVQIEQDLARATEAPALAGIAAPTTVSGRVVGSPLFSPNVAGLARDDRYWKDFSTQRFKASGGDAQFVTIREGLLVYRQKSLDFDPSPVAAAGAAVTELGLKVAAAAAIGDVSGLMGEAQDDGAEPSAEQLVSAAKVDELETALRRSRQQRFVLLGKLADLLERLSDGMSDDARAAVVRALKSDIDFFNGVATQTEAEVTP